LACQLLDQLRFSAYQSTHPLDAITATAMSEKNPNAESFVNPEKGRHGLYVKLREAGVLDQVAEAIKRGDTLQKVADLCASLGFPCTPVHVHRIRRRVRLEWEEAEFRRKAMESFIDGAGDHDTALEVLIDRTLTARFASMIEDAEGPDALERVMPLWTAWKRMRTAERAEARAERAEERAAKEISKAVAVKFLDMLNSEDMAAKLRAVRDDAILSGGGIEAQVAAIQNHLWGDLFDKAA
jgi:hypothetical protein